MTFDADELENGARAATGLDDFGSPYYREGLDRIVEALNTEADLNDVGQVIQHATLSNALIQRLKVEHTYRQHPEIDDEEIGGPVFVIGLPRTGTTALSQLVAADPQFRSLRMWESQAPTPPPESATQHTDPRIAQAEAGLQLLDEMFPLMKTLYNSEPTAPTECQDLMGMSFRTFHFDGAVRAPGYLSWLMGCDMRETYTFHRRVLKLLQWHCPPVLWHLKTPVHMFALEALVEAYPNARFLWSHRDPAKVMGSVCSLIQYVRSWSSDRNDPEELGAEQVDSWVEAVRRAMDFRTRMGSHNRFADVSFADLQTDPVRTLRDGYQRLGLTFTDATAESVKQWAGGHQPGARGTHDYDLAEYGLTPDGVRERFADYLSAYDATA
ncbi:sulfotransferase [Mycobacterium sp. 1100029.7]|nr:sulfotransferase [Mycobacterium sp. 1100029.7]